MRALTSKDGAFSFHFDKIDESQAEIDITSLKHILVKNYDVVVTRGKNKGHLPFQHMFWILLNI